MKKICLLLLLLIVQKSYSQTQNNILPTSGPVGIGTTSPSFPLDVHSSNQRLYNSSGSAFLRIEGNGSSSNNLGSYIYLNAAAIRVGDTFNRVSINANRGADSTANFQLTRMNGNTISGIFYQYSDPLGHRFFGAPSRDAANTTEVLRISPEGRIGMGATVLTNRNLALAAPLTGGTVVYGILNHGVVKSDVTAGAYFNYTQLNTQANSPFTLPMVAHYSATQGVVDTSSKVNSQIAFWASSNLTSGINNYGFRGGLNAGSGRFNLFMDGTANNYIAGNVGIGTTNPLSPLHVTGVIRTDAGIGIGTSTLTGYNIRNSRVIDGASTSYGTYTDGVVQSGVSVANLYTSLAQTVSASNLSSLVHYFAQQGNVAGSVTSQTGFYVSSTMKKGTNVYGFRGLVESDSVSKRWNLYMDGDASNYLKGNLGIGITNPLAPLHVNGVIRTDVGIVLGASSVLNPDQSFNIRNSKAIGGAATSHGTYTDGIIQTELNVANLYTSHAQSTAASNVNLLTHYNAQQGTLSGNVTSQTGFFVSENLTKGTNIFGFRGKVQSEAGKNRWNLYMDGTAPNYLSGNVGISTLNPTQKLHVTGNILTSAKLGFNNDINNYYIGGIANGMEYRPFNVGKFDFTSGNGTWLFENGNVAIGTSTVPSGYKVAVAGNMIVEKIKVKKQVGGAWPDYVFSPSYKLPSLDEVELFTKKHSHLPEIPSAKEIEKEGQDLGEMNRLLLKKVEELTLYLIEERKTNIDQGAQLKQLQEEINQLKKNLK